MNFYANINTIFIFLFKWCPDAESNHGHRDFQSLALPTELSGHNGGWTEIRTLTACAFAGFQDRSLSRSDIHPQLY